MLYASLENVQKYLILLSDIKVTMPILTACPENVNIVREYDELLYDFRINLELTKVPEEILRVIDLIQPGLQVSVMDSDNLDNPKNMRDLQTFLNFEKRLSILLKRFRDKLVNQFSYYVTSNEFLNNPIKKTVFVIDSATYRKLNFPSSGLYQDEIFDMEKSAFGSYVYQRLEDFYTDLQDYFTKAIFDSRDQIEMLVTFDEVSAIQNFMGIYEMAVKNKTGVSIAKIKKQLSEPRYHEAINNLLIRNRLDMYKALEELDMDRISEKCMEKKLPWNQYDKSSRKKDIDTLHFLYDIQMRYLPEKSIPYTSCQKIFNLFSSCKTATRRGSPHLKIFSNMKVSDYPDSYIKEYVPLLEL